MTSNITSVSLSGDGLGSRNEPTGIYSAACPNCAGPVSDDRLLHKLPCYGCMPERVFVESLSEIARILREKGSLREDSSLAFYADVEERARRVEEFFEKATGLRLWSAQRLWVRRVLKGKSFAIIAPTGVGKTTFGILMAVYFAAVEGRKSYIVVPTTPLVQMVEEKARAMAERAGVNVRILSIHSRLTVKERNTRYKRFFDGDFDILVTTSRFMLTRQEEIVKVARKIGGFAFVFVDDVDAVLKSSKSVLAVLRIVGFTDKLVGTDGLGWQLIRLRQRLVYEAERAAREFQKAIDDMRKAAHRAGRQLMIEEIRDKRIEIVRKRLEKVYREIREIEKEIEKERRRAAVLVVSSATGRPRGRLVRLFQVLLGFQAGSRSETLRNILDTYIPAGRWELVEERLVKVLNELKSRCQRCGGIVYVPVDRGSEYAVRLAELLSKKGISAEAFTSKNVDALERFRRGEIDVLVGVAIYYGVAVRGLDIPERICYTVFAGVPRIRFSARFEDPHPISIIRALAILVDHAPEDVARNAERYLVKLRRLYQRLSQAAIQLIAEELRRGQPRTDASKAFMEALEFIRTTLTRSDVWDQLEKATDIAIVREGEKSYILVPDAPTYIQASGRTSRLYAGGITRGLSVVIVDDERLMNGLMRRTKWYADVEWRLFDEIDLDRIVREMEADREDLLAVVSGRKRVDTYGRELVTTALLIVESPNKARTIASFFGRPSVREVGPLRVYEVSTGDYMLLVTASGGHVYDLVKPIKPSEHIEPTWLLDVLNKSTETVNWNQALNVHGIIAYRDGNRTKFLPVYSPMARCLVCGHQWALDPAVFKPRETVLKCPVCGSPFVRNSWESIEALRDLASEVDVVFIGTDPDTEGEKIGWDLAVLIAPYAKSIARIEFHEITRKAILNAIRNPKPYGVHKMAVYVRETGEEVEVPAINLVHAQIVRRVEDRWIGFTLSPILWTLFWPRFCQKRVEKAIERYKQRLGRREAERKGLDAKIRGMDINRLLSNIQALAEKRSGLNKSIQEVREVLANLEELKRRCERPNYNLSAGRVQTPVLGWIVERTLKASYALEPVVRLFIPDLDLYIELEGEEVDKRAANTVEKIKNTVKEVSQYIADGPRAAKIASIEEAINTLSELKHEIKRVVKELGEQLKGKVIISVEVVSEEDVDVKPLPPFTTDTLLSEAAARLGLGAPQAMRLAQDLFEMGFITYHRTDSTRISELGIAIAKEYLRERYGDKFEELFTPRSWGAGGAHEAIRPTRPIDANRLRRLVEEGIIQPVRPLTRRHYMLYDLIFRRFIASQMKPAKLRKQVAKLVIDINGKRITRIIERYVGIVEKGFLDVYPVLDVTRPLKPGTYRAEVETTVRPMELPITQAETVRKMRDKNIGRPSTYAKIVETLLRRAYVVSPGGRILKATQRGIGVYDFLIARFPDLVSEKVTRELQEQMDKIELGKQNYQDVLDKMIREIKEVLERNDDFRDYAPPLPV